MYPFVPEKISQIKEGEFFYIPLSNGFFACGRLLEIERSESGRKINSVIVGLHDWKGKEHPKPENLHGVALIEQGVINIKSVGHVNGAIIGFKALEEDKLTPLLQFEAGNLLAGFENLGPIPSSEYKKYPRRSTYGLDVIRLLAEKHFVN